MNKERITHLNQNRYIIKKSIEKIKNRISITRNRLHDDLERLNTLENNYELINRQIIRIFNQGTIPDIQVIKYQDEKDNERIMLKIDIDNSGKSIYKSIPTMDLMLYKIAGDPIEDMNFKHRIEEIAFEYLESRFNINDLFNDLTHEANEIIEHFIGNN